jgi:hypothetical protein
MRPYVGARRSHKPADFDRSKRLAGKISVKRVTATLAMLAGNAPAALPRAAARAVVPKGVGSRHSRPLEQSGSASRI